MRLLFLRLNKRRNTKKNNFWGGFLQKHTFFRGSKMVLFKSQISNFVFLRLFFNVKGRFMPIFTQKINIWAPWNFFKKKTLTPVRSALGNFGIGLLNSYLTFGYLTCSVRSTKISTLHPNIGHVPTIATVHTT